MSLELIKKLREQTGAGFSDCQNALTQAQGDLAQAVEILRKKGQKIAEKKQDRVVKEGVIALSVIDQKAAVIELFCETDFVARNENFLKAAQELADKFLETKPTVFNNWAKEKIQNELIVKIGENIQLGRTEIIEGKVIGSYLHFTNKVAAVVVLNSGPAQLAKELAMQVVAMDPKYLTPAEMPTEIIDKEKEVYRGQSAAEKKPVAIIEKIVEGKLEKFYSEICLLKQTYIKDEEKTIEQLIDETSDKAGFEIKVERFLRFSL